MLYLDSIAIHNFKSFRHANIKLLNGFNCIVGPNGSGKSNICDSILFALGESSLKRLRVTKSDQLIHGSAKVRRDGAKRAYVKLVFAGDKTFEIARIIKSNGKIGYRIDGKRATRHDVVDALRSYRCAVDETNVIAQGEISYMQSLSAKQRRELIDVAAGIREFDEKKDISLKELEKVDTKLREAQIELGLKRGFLNEIEKQKNDAEAYISHRDYVSRGTFTILKAREQEIGSQYDSALAEIKSSEEKKLKINEVLLKIEASLGKITSERGAYSKELNEKSVEVSSTSKRMDEIEKEKAVKESESNAIKERIAEREGSIDSSIKELDQIRAKIKTGSELEGELATKLKLKEAETGHASLESLAGDTNTGAMLDLLNKNQGEIDAIQSRYGELAAKLVKASTELELIGREKDAIESSAKAAEKELLALNKEKKSKSELLSSITKEKEQIKRSITLALSELSEKREELNSIDGRTLSIREQLAMSGAGADKRIGDELSKSLGDGFYGPAHSLCTYEDRYDAAVSASAGSRLNYFVVENKKVAEEAISILKSKQLGRAAFIPLDFIAAQEEKSAHDLLISHVKFDKRFERAFRYIFSNTCVVNSISEVKKSDLSKNRFVTYEGELVEQSGVISGGVSKRQASASSLQSRLRSIEAEKAELARKIRETDAALEATKKSYSEIESREMDLSFNLKRMAEQIADLEKAAKDSESKREKITKSSEQLRQEQLKYEGELKALEEQIKELKKGNEALVKRSSESEKPKEHRTKAISKYKEVMKEIEGLKMQHASTAKENEMLNHRSSEIETAIESLKIQIKADRSKLAVLDNELIELSRAKAELHEEIKSQGAKHGSLLSKIDALDASATKLAEEKGRSTFEMGKAERQSAEIGMRRAQLQQRLADIRAELTSYSNIEPIVGEEVPNIEDKITRAKIQLESLGNVNLKAPELYNEKKQEVTQAEEKMGVLASEKESILVMIKEIEGKKLGVFKETFNQVNDNFKRLHGYVFGGDGHLALDDAKDPLNSGLNIVITQTDRRSSNIVEQFSGGEKSLIVLMLIFSIQMRNPLSFYLFDEIDVSLDKENVKKLSKLVGELSKTSQMIVVSHNDTMITGADSAIGVIRRSGESNAMGLQIGSGAKVGA